MNFRVKRDGEWIDTDHYAVGDEIAICGPTPAVVTEVLSHEDGTCSLGLRVAVHRPPDFIELPIAQIESQKLNQFRDLADKLREQRRLSLSARNLAYERNLLDQLGDMFDGMNDDEQEVAAGEGWRGWPDLYDAKEKK